MVVAGANDYFAPEDVVADTPLLRGARFALLQLEVPIPTTIAGATAARAAGLEVILDPAPAPQHLPAELFKFVDVLTPNETEAAVLVGRKSAEVSVDEARTIAAELQSRGVRHVIIKLGVKGCLLLEAGTATHVPPPMVRAVDSTGAGDIFNAAFVVAAAEGASRLDACQFAVHAAALSATRMGCQASVPTRVELDAYLRQT
jgi:ribokinase